MIGRMGDWLLLHVGTRLAALLIRLLHASMRVEFLDEQYVKNVWANNEAVILSFWHDQLLLMVKGYRGPGAKILISASKDGELIAWVMRWFGQGAVRGSSSRGGKAALKQMIQLGKEPYDLVFTPDGPRGPRHEIKPGVAQLARLSGRPVVPMAFACSRGHRFASWDRFLLPFPFSRAVFAFGPPLTFAEHETVDAFCERLQQAMDDNTQRAGGRLEAYGVSAV